LRHRQTKRTRWIAVASGAVVAAAVTLVLTPPSAGALTAEECAEVVAEGKQAREDLAKLIESQDPDSTATTSAEIGTYVEELLESAAINQFGFVSADAGAPLELCVPKGTTKLTLFSDPVVLWEGLATTDAFPVTVTIPTSVDCGTHELVATGPGVEQTVETTVGGTCADPDSDGGALPRTGAEIGTTLGIGVALVAVGWSVLRGRRRQHRSSAA
jgi:LPXTG-motif cell wall-anchored protein